MATPLLQAYYLGVAWVASDGAARAIGLGDAIRRKNS